jgi:hypothetical protein
VVSPFAILVGVTDLTQESFPDFVAVHRFAVVHFWAEWNGYDAKMQHLLETRIPDEISKMVAFGRFDTGPAEHWEILRGTPSAGRSIPRVLS